MKHNVGRTEQMARLALGTIAGVVALGTRGWQRGALCGISTAGFLTGLTRYCPVNEALGVDHYRETPRFSPHDEQVRDTEIRRQTQTAGAMGELPGTTVSPVTR
jgi:hypothetical protein